MYILYLFERK